MNSIREMSGKLHEFMIALDKAGFGPRDIQRIVNSGGNKLAEKMHEAISVELEQISKTEKFTLLVDLGVIVIPNNYIHSKCFSVFQEKYRVYFGYYGKNIRDTYCPKPSRILKRGEKLNVCVYKQTRETTFEERLAFLDMQKAVYPGIQGTTHVFEQKRDLLPREMGYLSLDKNGHLFDITDKRERVPGLKLAPVLYVRKDGIFVFSTDSIENTRYHVNDVFFCFTEVDK